MVHIIVKNSAGDYANGTGFHIGNGYLVTARHVIENHSIEFITGETFSSEDISIKKVFYPSDPLIDLAVLETNFSLQYFMEKVSIIDSNGVSSEKASFIPLGGHLDDWLGDELVLSKVIVMGYPGIPFSREAVLVAVQGEVNAVIDKYRGPHPHFIISSMPRGGFSGGPVISEYGFLLGVFIESLFEGGKTAEMGFASVLTIEPLLVLLQKNGIKIRENSNVLDWEP
ncbi:MAG TPA: serine protease [Ktedonobacteraceae bacterium]|nr:serine protease [Ktedonobacteraceae bacterium]